MDALTQEDKDACRDAFRAISAIEFLTKRPEFETWIKGHREEVKKIELAILEKDMPADEREKLRQRRFGMLEVINSPAKDMESHVKMLALHGYTPGDKFEDLRNESAR